MKSFISQAQCYAAYHQHPKTRQTHCVGVPLIVFSLMILLGFVKIIIPGVFATTLACLTTLGVLIYYFRLYWPLALTLTPFMLLMLWLADWLSSPGPNPLGLWLFILSFIGGWALQLYGHYVAKERPAFMTSMSQMLIAPLYLMAELFFMAGLFTSLKRQIHNEDNASREAGESRG